MILLLGLGGIGDIVPLLMTAVAGYLDSSPIFPSSGMTFKELSQEYVLIESVYLPVVELMRDHPVEKAAAMGPQTRWEGKADCQE
jgi:hypothetical protein